MKLTRILNLVLILLLVFSSCSENSDLNILCSNIDYKVKLLKSDPIEITIPDSSYSLFNSRTTKTKYINNTWYIFRLYNNIFTILNPDNDSSYNEIHFDVTARIGFSEVTDFYVVDFDSIFIFSEAHQKIALVDTSCEVIDIYDVRSTINDEPFDVGAMPAYGMSMDYNNLTANIILYSYPYIEAYEEEFYNYSFMKNYSISEKKYVGDFGFYPKYFNRNSNYYPMVFPTFISFDSITVISFMPDQNMHVFNNQANKHKDSYCAYFGDKNQHTKGFPTSEFELQEGSNWYNSENYYPNIVYNTKNELIYRIYKHAQPLKNESGHINFRFNSDVSILIFNREFEKIGEHLISNGEYTDYFNIYPFKEGIIISKKTNDENKIQFDYYKVVVL